MSSVPSPYSVDGYSSFTNMWDKVYDMQLGKHHLKSYERRIRSNTTVYLTETHDMYLTPTASYRDYQYQQRDKGGYLSKA